MSEAALKLAPRAPATHIHDAALLERVRDGDMGALGVLFDRYNKDLRRLIARLGVATDSVDDLVQLTFLDALRSAAHYDGRNSAKPWLSGIAVMLVRRHRRSLSRLVQRLSAWALEASEDYSDETPEKAIETSETVRRAQRALQNLSSKKREVFVLVALEGLPGEQVASALGIPVATVWTRLHHARRELREALLQEES